MREFNVTGSCNKREHYMVFEGLSDVVFENDKNFNKNFIDTIAERRNIFGHSGMGQGENSITTMKCLCELKTEVLQSN